MQMFNKLKENNKIQFIKKEGYLNATNREELNILKEKIYATLKNMSMPLINESTGLSAKINSKCIGKLLFPAPYFNPYTKDYIPNLNACCKLEELFTKAIYFKSFKAMKTKNKWNEYHYFVAPLIMNNNKYRFVITVCEHSKSHLLYIIATKLEFLGIANKQNNNFITVKELVKNIKIYNYMDNSYENIDIKTMRNNKIIKETSSDYQGFSLLIS